MLQSKEVVCYNNTTIGKRIHKGAGVTNNNVKVANAKDLNIDDRIIKLRDILKNEHVYRIPPRYFTDLGKINFFTKIDFRIKSRLETETEKLFESKKLVAAGAAIAAPDVKIILTKAPFVQYEQILLNKNFRQYLETIMVSKKVLRMGAQKKPIQKTYEINIGQDSLDVDFLGVTRQIDQIEILLVYDKSNKRTRIYDSYNVQMASKKNKSIKLNNFTESYSLTNEKIYGIDNLTQKYLLSKKFVAWSCNGSSVAPLTDYINNPIYKQLIEEDT